MSFVREPMPDPVRDHFFSHYHITGAVVPDYQAVCHCGWYGATPTSRDTAIAAYFTHKREATTDAC